MWQSVPMRRKDRALTKAEAEALLATGEYGVLASANGEGIPLATPLSYIYKDGAIYFHSAKKGQKIGNIAAQSRVSFCVVGKTQPDFANGDFTTYFESAVAHCTASLVTDEAEARKALEGLCEKYLPEFMDAFDAAMEKSFKVTAVVRIDVDELTAKAKRQKAE
ncbi:pyridoxamine 5'-phosphate oxidase family protein [Ruminococcaceae bacterium OttesenSCG-928-D13]|nr:pyridoxamine 5'-phosphate oxidase family protein [Ruminococcaceae bacterium OttesenSCG-928-D13]